MEIGQTEKMLEEQSRKSLRDLLAQCTDKQIDLFNRMYVSVEEIPKEKMLWAFKQCERTIIDNLATQGK